MTITFLTSVIGLVQNGILGIYTVLCSPVTATYAETLRRVELGYFPVGLYVTRVAWMMMSFLILIQG